jgi:hopanoid biosynthesis associated RND transporter like protein HpnN
MSDTSHSEGSASLIVRGLVEPLRLMLYFPRASLAIALLLGVLAGGLAVTQLGYKAGRSDLIATESDYNQLWLQFNQEFGEQDDALIVVEGTSRENVVPVMRELSLALAKQPEHFRAVMHEVDLKQLRSKGLHYMGREELLGVEASLQESLPIIGGEWNRLQISQAIGGMAYKLNMIPPEQAAVRGELIKTLERYLTALSESLRNSQQHYTSPWPEMPVALNTLKDINSEALLAKEGTLGFVLMRMDAGADKLTPYSESTLAARKIIAAVQRNHPQLKIGLTGLPVMEYDEMQASQSSMLWASLVSLAGVMVVIVAGFGGIRHALLANLVLLLGMAWAFGYAVISVGHLNILSVTFTATLIGVGIDYGTYYVARYLQYRDEGLGPYDAIIRTSTIVGPGIFTGALTTSIAFFSAAWTNFTGVAELGVIAGGGLILCAIAQLYVLPVCLYLVDASSWGEKMPAPLPVERGFQPFWKQPKTIALFGMAATIMLGMGLPKLWYDHNLLNLQPDNLESVAWERKLLTESGRSVWYAISIADTPEELLRRKQEFLKKPSVERIEEIVSLLPGNDLGKSEVVTRIAGSLGRVPERPPLIAVDLLEELGVRLGQVEMQLQNTPGLTHLATYLETIRQELRQLPPAECYARLSGFQQHAAGDLISRLHLLSQFANPEPPQFKDLPPSLVDRFMSNREAGTKPAYLLKIYGRGDIWDMDSLSQFVHQVREVDARATGNPLQAYEASREMKQSFEQSALYSLIIITVVLWLDFRSLWYCLLAAFPLLISMVQTFGLLAWINQPLNPANMIALPLIMGIGIDYGVHIVHNFLEQKRNYRMSPATALAVTVDALTTIIGFGSLLIASHCGLQSLGRVLTLGITICTLVSLLLLPAILTLISQWRDRWMPAIDEEASVAELSSAKPSMDHEVILDPKPRYLAPVAMGRPRERSLAAVRQQSV